MADPEKGILDQAQEETPAVEEASGDTLGKMAWEGAVNMGLDAPLPPGPWSGVLEPARALYRAKKSTEPGEPLPPPGGTEPLPDFQPTYTLEGVEPGGIWGSAPKGGKGKPIGSIKVEAKAQPPLAVMAAMAHYKEKLKNDIAQQLEERGAGLGIAANINRDLQGALQQNAAKTYKEVDALFSEAETQLQGVQELIEAARSNRINPGQFFANVGDAGTFTASMAVAVGHLASALGGGPNTAFQIIKGAIDRNVQSQIINQAHDRAMVAHQLAFVDRLTSLGINRMNAGNVHRAALVGVAQAALASNAAETSQNEIKAMIQQLDSQLEVEMATSIAKAYEDITATAAIKYYSMAQADSAARAVAGAARSAVAAQTGQAGGTRPVRPGGGGMGAAPAAGRGRSRGRGQVPPPPDLSNAKNVQEAAQIAANNFRIRFQGNPTKEDFEAYASQFDGAVATAMRAMDREAFVPIESPDQVATISVSGRTRQLVKKPQYRRLEEESYTEAEQKREIAQTSIQIHEWMDQIDQVLKAIAGGRAVTIDENNVPRVLGLNEDPEFVNHRKALEMLVINIANQERTRLGSDAIRSISEWDVWKQIKGVKGVDEMKMRKWLRALIRNPQEMANLNRAEFRPALELQDQIVHTSVDPWFYMGSPAEGQGY